MRSASLLGTALVVALAGCGAPAEHAATQPVRVSAPAPKAPPSKVFTVPAKLPPRAHAAAPKPRPATPPAAHNPDTAQGGGPPSDAQVQRELARALGVAPGGDVIDQAGLTRQGLATVPPTAPAKVAAIITAANQVARAPYVYGGGHGGVGGDENWVDTAYDCSGSVSFALASAGLVSHQMDSTSFMSWGKPGPGRWVTVFANHGHAFMVVAGLRFDTVERARTGTRWGQTYRSVSGFTVRHPAGL